MARRHRRYEVICERSFSECLREINLRSDLLRELTHLMANINQNPCWAKSPVSEALLLPATLWHFIKSAILSDWKKNKRKDSHPSTDKHSLTIPTIECSECSMTSTVGATNMLGVFPGRKDYESREEAREEKLKEKNPHSWTHAWSACLAIFPQDIHSLSHTQPCPTFYSMLGVLLEINTEDGIFWVLPFICCI